MEFNGKPYRALLSIQEIPTGKALTVNDEQEGDLAVFHHNGRYYITSNICPHHHASVLAQGYVEDGVVICPLHHYEYSLESGACLTGGADIKVYDYYVENEILYIEDKPATQPKWMSSF